MELKELPPEPQLEIQDGLSFEDIWTTWTPPPTRLEDEVDFHEVYIPYREHKCLSCIHCTPEKLKKMVSQQTRHTTRHMQKNNKDKHIQPHPKEKLKPKLEEKLKEDLDETIEEVEEVKKELEEEAREPTSQEAVEALDHNYTTEIEPAYVCRNPACLRRSFTPLRRCGRCSTKGNAFLPECLKVFYCSRTCQKQDWNAHKRFCFLPEVFEAASTRGLLITTKTITASRYALHSIIKACRERYFTSEHFIFPHNIRFTTSTFYDETEEYFTNEHTIFNSQHFQSSNVELLDCSLFTKNLYNEFFKDKNKDKDKDKDRYKDNKHKYKENQYKENLSHFRYYDHDMDIKYMDTKYMDMTIKKARQDDLRKLFDFLNCRLFLHDMIRAYADITITPIILDDEDIYRYYQVDFTLQCFLNSNYPNSLLFFEFAFLQQGFGFVTDYCTTIYRDRTPSACNLTDVSCVLLHMGFDPNVILTRNIVNNLSNLHKYVNEAVDFGWDITPVVISSTPTEDDPFAGYKSPLHCRIDSFTLQKISEERKKRAAHIKMLLLQLIHQDLIACCLAYLSNWIVLEPIKQN